MSPWSLIIFLYRVKKGSVDLPENFWREHFFLSLNVTKFLSFTESFLCQIMPALCFSNQSIRIKQQATELWLDSLHCNLLSQVDFWTGLIVLLFNFRMVLRIVVWLWVTWPWLVGERLACIDLLLFEILCLLCVTLVWFNLFLTST